MRLSLVLRFVAVLALSFGSIVWAQKPKTLAHRQLPEDYSFTIKASPSWTDTGIDLEQGDRIHVIGPVSACEGPSPNEKAHLPLPSAPGGALLLKLHLEADPIPASPDADLPILNPSHLYFSVNGWHCDGTIPVRVHVEWHKPPAHTP